MGHGCCTSNKCGTARNFWTKQEKVEMLKEYQKSLEHELQGVKERIESMEGH